MTSRSIIRLIVAASLTLGASAGHAWGVLGCDFGPDVPAFISCVNNASSTAAQQAANNAAKAYETTIDGLEGQVAELQNSPYLANLPGEQQALLALRQMPIEAFRACLADAGLQLGNVMAGAMSNPPAFAQARLTELFANAAALGSPMLDASLAGLRQGQTPQPGPATVSAYVDRAYDALTLLAEEDPVARCSLPLLNAMQTQVRQTAIAMYAQAEATGNQIVETVVRPALDQALTVSLGDMLTEIAGTPQAAPPTKRPPPQRQRPVDTTPKSTTLQKAPTTKQPLSRTDSLSRTSTASRATAQPPLRTRSIRDIAQGAATMAVPDDVERIALGVFTERMLNPRALQQLASEVNALSAALANGAAGNFDSSNLDKLIGELSVSNDALATELGIEVTRFYGHWTIDKVGGLLIDAGLGSAAASEAVVMEVAGGICSIGDVFSGVPCAIVKGIVSFVYMQVALPALNQAMMAGYHVAYEQAVNCAAQAIRSGQNPSSRSPQGCGSLGGLLTGFPSGQQLAAFALPTIDQTQTALFAYQQAVGNLATVSRNLARR